MSCNAKLEKPGTLMGSGLKFTLLCKGAKLALEVDQFAEHFIGGGDDLGVGLKTTLGGYHFNELGSQVDSGLFQGIGEDIAQFGSGDADAGGPESPVAENRLAPSFCRPLKLENLASTMRDTFDLLTIGILGQHVTFVVDGDIGQVAGAIAVLGLGNDLRIVGELGCVFCRAKSIVCAAVPVTKSKGAEGGRTAGNLGAVGVESRVRCRQQRRSKRYCCFHRQRSSPRCWRHFW